MTNTPLKVLVVDDEPDIVEILSYNLKKQNYIVFEALNGEDAILSAGKNHPDPIDAGGDHFITKPIRPALLIGMIKELIQKA